MAYIESHQELARHPKVKRFARMLKISLPAAIGHLHFLWWWAMDYAQDGDLSRFDAFDIADAAAWEGDEEEFIEALMNCGAGGASGFVDSDAEGKWIHDWDQYGGKLLASRQAAALRAKRHRGKEQPEEGGEVASPLRNAHETRTLPVTLNKTTTTERSVAERRQDKRSEDKPPSSSTSGVRGADAADLGALDMQKGPRPKAQEPLAGSYPPGWNDAEGLSPGALLKRYRDTFGAEGEGRITRWLANAKKPVHAQAPYLRPCILGWLRGDDPDPVATPPITSTIHDMNAAAAAQAESLRSQFGSVGAALNLTTESAA